MTVHSKKYNTVLCSVYTLRYGTDIQPARPQRSRGGRSANYTSTFFHFTRSTLPTLSRSQKGKNVCCNLLKDHGNNVKQNC